MSETRFDYNGENFVIRTRITDNEIQTRVYLNGKVVSPTYSITKEVNEDFTFHLGMSGQTHLEGLAQSDVEQELYYKRK